MSKGCWDCTFKHLAAAAVAADEMSMGYSLRGKMLLIGHMTHAESECLALYSDFALLIREHRIRVMPSREKAHVIPFEALCDYVMANVMAGDGGAGLVIPDECFAGLEDDVCKDWPANMTGDART